MNRQLSKIDSIVALWQSFSIKYFRSEDGTRINQLLTEESIIKRNRKTAIGMQSTTISWALEFLGGLIPILTYILVEERDQFTDFIVLLPVVCLNFILIPASYLMILESYKQQIVEQGWFESFMILIRNSNSVKPSGIVNLEFQATNSSTLSLKTTPNKHIRTISGKVAKRERHFENNIII